MRKNKLARPFLKWAGGKRQLLPELKKHLPASFNTYYEPFVGAGALLFHLQPPKAVINDVNEQLINCYRAILSHLDELIADLKKHVNSEAYYYQMRDLDRKSTFNQMSLVEKASRLIYLNKTCYNGLFRVNSQGQFNVPFGSYKNPKIVDVAVLTAVNAYLTNNAVTIFNMDFEKAVAGAQKGDFVYLDPPYDPVSDTSSFTGYSTGGFGKEEQKRLKLVFDDLTRRGCKVMLSNSATKFILDLYGEYRDYTIFVAASRAINSVAAARGKIDEVLVMNYATGNGSQMSH